MSFSGAGVGVALALYDMTIALVNCHLASKNIKQRRQQYVDLVARYVRPLVRPPGSSVEAGAQIMQLVDGESSWGSRGSFWR